MNEHRKSDSSIVPGKPSNKGRGAPRSAERVEERGLAKENPLQQTRLRTQGWESLQHELARIRRATFGRHYPRQEPSAVIPHAGICAGGVG